MDDTPVPLATTSPSAVAIPRTWRSLLSGRWHRSSWVVAMLVLLFMVFCNVPGQLVTKPSIELDYYDWVEQRLEHGWPLAWAMRERLVWGMQEGTNCWAFWQDNPTYHWQALAPNLITALGIALAVGAGFELWRRARPQVWQLHLRDLLAVVLVVSMAGAWYAAEQRRHARDVRIVGPFASRKFEIDTPDHGISYYDTTVGGPTWLRRLLGEERFEFLDRVIAVDCDPEGLPWAVQLPDLRSVQVSGDITSSDLVLLKQLPYLECLDIDSQLPTSSSDRTHSSPRIPQVTMPQLAGLRCLSVRNIDCQKLKILSSLECVEWTGEFADEPLFRQLGSLPRLRSLHLSQCAVWGAGLSHLRPRQSLSRLTFTSAGIDADCIRQIGQLTQLKELALPNCSFDPTTLSQLTGLTQLETLNLSGTDVDSQSIASLAKLPRLRELDLNNSRVNDTAIVILAKMEHLQELYLPIWSFSKEQQQRLKGALPGCKVTFVDPLY